jgi:formylglycine-generating enzyme required for sulfatase activity
MSFESVRQQYAALRRQFAAGEITYQQLQDHLSELIVKDRDGVEWRIDPGSGEWLRYEEDEGWVEDEPSLSAWAGDETQELTRDSDEPQRTLDLSWLAGNWGWVVMIVAGLAFVGAAAFLLYTLFSGAMSPAEVVAVAREPVEPTTQAASTSAPVDISVPPTPTPTPTPAPESEIVDDGHPMALVPAETFVMGSTEADIGAAYALCESLIAYEECVGQDFEAETPAHEVSLDAFYIDQYEVTNREYADFLNEADNQVEGGVPWLEVNDDQVRIQEVDGVWEPLPGFGDHPVTEVTWHGAQAYCRSRGGRLPTEAEWEKAARWNPDTGEVTRYPWGNQAPDVNLANYGPNVGHTTPVGSYPEGRSALGLYDMAGNVFEWVSDWYSPDFYADAPTDNPQGPDEGNLRVVRGGSWGDFPFLLRSANRGVLGPEGALNFIGFRCVLELDAVSR